MELSIPKLLYKFKSLATIRDLERLIDILKNNRIYIPQREQLNDPLEGLAIETSTATAGASIRRANDVIDAGIEGAMNIYRILSLTSNVFSPQMWAHYSNIYTGVCVGYYTHGVFAMASQVKYITQRPEAVSETDRVCVDERYYLLKEAGWSYEKEWRIVKCDPTGKNKYLEYLTSDLACVIFGNRIRPETRELIQAYIPQGIPQYIAVPGERSFRIHILPVDYERNGGGSTPPFIKNPEELLNHIRSNCVK